MKFLTKKTPNMAPVLPVPCENSTWMRKHRPQVPALFDSNFSDWYLKPLLIWSNFLHRSLQKIFLFPAI